jgi:cell division septal protein FtsQ
MKKLYKVVLLILTLIFLSTFNPIETENFFNKKSLLGIEKIEIVNNHIIKKNKILEKLHNIYGKNILLVKGREIIGPLKSINFLEKIEVKKKYPSTIIIKVFETRPVAILYKKNNKYFLDNLSNMILFKENIFTEIFPGVFGEGAEYKFGVLFDELNNTNFPKEKIKKYYYFQIGRWDLQLQNNQVIKLPPDKTLKAIKKSIELLNRNDFKNYNVIDLRIHGKIVVE